MSSPIVSKAAAIGCPVAAADATGRKGVHRYAGSGSSASAAIPDGWLGNIIRVASHGVVTQVAVGYGSAPSLTYNQTAAIGTGNAGAGATVADGTSEPYLIPVNATHIAWVSASAAGFVEFWLDETRSLGPVTGRQS